MCACVLTHWARHSQLCSLPESAQIFLAEASTVAAPGSIVCRLECCSPVHRWDPKSEEAVNIIRMDMKTKTRMQKKNQPNCVNLQTHLWLHVRCSSLRSLDDDVWHSISQVWSTTCISLSHSVAHIVGSSHPNHNHIGERFQTSSQSINILNLTSQPAPHAPVCQRTPGRYALTPSWSLAGWCQCDCTEGLKLLLWRDPQHPADPW